MCSGRPAPCHMYIVFFRLEPRRDFQQCGMWDQHNLRPACTYAQSDQSLCWLPKYSITVKLLTEHHLEFLSLNGGCTGSSESTHVNNTTLLEITCRGLFILMFLKQIKRSVYPPELSFLSAHRTHNSAIIRMRNR